MLNLAGFDCDLRDVEARILSGLNGDKLRGVESPGDSVQRTLQGSLASVFRRPPETSSGAGAEHPYEVPVPLANQGIEVLRRSVVDKSPVFTAGLQQRMQTIRKDAALAKEHRMQVHALALFDASDSWAPIEPVKGVPVTRTALERVTSTVLEKECSPQ